MDVMAVREAVSGLLAAGDTRLRDDDALREKVLVPQEAAQMTAVDAGREG